MQLDHVDDAPIRPLTLGFQSLSLDHEPMDVDDIDTAMVTFEDACISMDTSSPPRTPAFVYSSRAPDYPMSFVHELTSALQAVMNNHSTQVVDGLVTSPAGNDSASPASIPDASDSLAFSPVPVEEYEHLFSPVPADLCEPLFSPVPVDEYEHLFSPVPVDEYEHLFSPVPADLCGPLFSPVPVDVYEHLFSPVPLQQFEHAEEQTVEACAHPEDQGPPSHLSTPAVEASSVLDKPPAAPWGDALEAGLAFAEAACALVDSVLLSQPEDSASVSDEGTLADSVAQSEVNSNASSCSKANFPFKMRRAERKVRFAPYDVLNRSSRRDDGDDPFCPRRTPKGKAPVRAKEPKQPSPPSPTAVIEEEPVSPTISFCGAASIDTLVDTLENASLSGASTVVEAEAESVTEAGQVSPLAFKGKDKGKGKVLSILRYSKATHPFKARREERKARFSPYGVKGHSEARRRPVDLTKLLSQLQRNFRDK